MSEHTPAPYSSARLAMAEEFKHQPGRAPINPRLEGSDMECAVMGRTPANLAVLPLLDLPRHRKVDPAVIKYWQALIESWRGPTIGRKRRARRARGRARKAKAQ